MNFEIDNKKQEIKEIVERCIRCGLCKPFCSVFKVEREEQFSPRGQAIMLDNNNFEKIIYDCNLCKACEKQCPLNLKLCNAFIKAREVMVMQKKELDSAKEVIKNLNKTGNIFGIDEKRENN
jgi:glycolate oxidase iron-sulfur subunit